MPQRFLDFAGLDHVGDHLHGTRVIVGEEQALAFIQLADGLHLLLGQREIKDVKVLLHPLLVGGFGDDHHVALQQKAQGSLRGGLVVLLADFVQNGIGEKVVASLGEGPPGLVLYAVLFHVLVRGLLLMEDVGLHLVDRRRDFGELAQVDQAVGIKVADADGAQLASTSLGMITINALAAADSVIIPVQAHYLPAKGMTQLIKNIARVKKRINPALKVDGVLLTLVDGRTNLARQTAEILRQTYGSVLKIYRSEIPVAIKAAETSAAGKSIYAYDKGSKVAQAYAEFSKEVLADGEKQRAKLQSSLSR